MTTFEEWTPPSDMRGGDRAPDKHVSILFEAELIGGHVHVKVRAATRNPSVQVDHSRGLCGELVFAPAEWLLLHHALRAVADVDGIPLPTWLISMGERFEDTYGYGGSCIKIAGAGIGVSDHADQQFIELKGWPDGP